VAIKVSRVLIVLLLCLAATPCFGADVFPPPQGAVNDFAGVIPVEQRQEMEALAAEVLQKTGTAVVVATVKSLGEGELNDTVNGLYSAWGIGEKGEDKGVLIFLALQERKIRIETGYGVEGILPDGKVGEILDADVLPLLRQNRYGQGLYNALAAVSAVVAKDAGEILTGLPDRGQGGGQQPQAGGWLTPLLIVLVLFFLLGTRQGRAMLPWILLLLSSGGGGRSGGGGFGGFGGGGFGGFGGGSSGGGGASRGF
jgi:uncharacterized protein